MSLGLSTAAQGRGLGRDCGAQGDLKDQLLH